MMKLLEYLGKQSKLYLMILGLALVGLIGIVDYLTGPELASSIFYLIPVALVAWLVGRQAGIALSIAGAISWLIADLLDGGTYSHPLIPFWNTLVRFGFFLIVTHVLSVLHAARERQEELRQFVVHDLRTPLSIVMTGLLTLQDLTGESMDATQKNLVEMCIVSSQRMATLINSLLDMARLESGQLSLQFSQVNVKELIESSLKQVSVLAKRSHVTLTSQLDPNLGMVYADAKVTTRVLVNLLVNAIKFSRPESVITIRTALYSANMAALSVTDQGRGVPKEWADKVFDKFAQVQAHRTGSAVGSGLGLTFCRLAVEAQGGRIWLDSEVNKGTTFTFTLPIDAT